VRHLGGNRKGFYKSLGRKTRENVAPLLNQAGAMVAQDRKKMRY